MCEQQEREGDFSPGFVGIIPFCCDCGLEEEDEERVKRKRDGVVISRHGRRGMLRCVRVATSVLVYRNAAVVDIWLVNVDTCRPGWLAAWLLLWYIRSECVVGGMLSGLRKRGVVGRVRFAV